MGIQTICGTDDRVPSYDVRQGRIVLNGSCTAWLVSESVFVTAGHCGIPKAASRMYFTYGPRGEVVPPEKQYAVEMSTYKRVYGNGRDWAAGRLMPNAITGWLAGMAQGGWYVIDTNAPIVNTDIRITGYGTDDDPTRNLMQQTHVRRVTEVTSTSVRYNADTMVSFRYQSQVGSGSSYYYIIHRILTFTQCLLYCTAGQLRWSRP